MLFLTGMLLCAGILIVQCGVVRCKRAICQSNSIIFSVTACT